MGQQLHILLVLRIKSVQGPQNWAILPDSNIQLKAKAWAHLLQELIIPYYSLRNSQI